MFNPTFALAMPHTPWVPARVSSFRRLCDQICVGGFSSYQIFTEKKPNMQWAQDLWRWGAGQSTTHLLQLQDDVVVCPNFWDRLREVVVDRPDEPICLVTPHEAFRDLFAAGCSWGSSHDGMVGVGWAAPVSWIQDLLRFVAEDMRPEAVAAHSEDSTMSLFAMATKQPIWHCLPSLVDHDLSVPSTYGHDGLDAKMRGISQRPTVPFTQYDGRPRPHSGTIGCVYDSERWRLRTYLTPEAVRKYRVIETMYSLT